MMSDLEKRAAELAAQPYSVEMIHDETTTGEPIIVLSHPELPGCMAQGSTIAEALTELADARTDYILSLMEDNLPVPAPLELKMGTGTTTAGTQGTQWQQAGEVKGSVGSEEDVTSPKSVIVSVVHTE